MATLSDYAITYNYFRKPLILNPINLLSDFRNASTTTSVDGDNLFQTYGIGNLTGGLINMPYERLKGYEMLLTILADQDIDHFRKIHKGTPYYFMGWTAFQLEDFEKGVFYMDSAISEDLRMLGPSYDINFGQTTPGINFLLLESGGQVAVDVATKLINAVEGDLTIFSQKASVTFNKDLFIQKFIKDSGLFRQGTFRTIVTSLYSFILEFQSRQVQLRLRSSEGGSIEPFLTHLFKGCVIWESLLKLLSPGDTKRTLWPAIEAHNTRLGIDLSLLPNEKTFEEVAILMRDMVTQSKNYQNISFATAYGMRNTTGHKLAWPDIFQNDDKVYEELYRAIVGALFWTIYKLWV